MYHQVSGQEGNHYPRYTILCCDALSFLAAVPDGQVRVKFLACTFGQFPENQLQQAPGMGEKIRKLANCPPSLLTSCMEKPQDSFFWLLTSGGISQPSWAGASKPYQESNGILPVLTNPRDCPLQQKAYGSLPNSPAHRHRPAGSALVSSTSTLFSALDMHKPQWPAEESRLRRTSQSFLLRRNLVLQVGKRCHHLRSKLCARCVLLRQLPAGPAVRCRWR